jgi:hypothetical protein
MAGLPTALLITYPLLGRSVYVIMRGRHRAQPFCPRKLVDSDPY